jgi:hypothetical protein
MKSLPITPGTRPPNTVSSTQGADGSRTGEPRLCHPPMQTERMSSKGKGKKTKAPQTVVRFKFGPDVRPHMVTEFRRTRGLPQIPELHPTPGLIAGRVSTFLQMVNNIVPAGTSVSVWPAINMADTLAQLAPDEYGPEAGNEYNTQRGANIATAKTMRRGDGRGFDIVVGGDWFISSRGDSNEQVADKSALLAHLAAHEPQHIVLTVAGLDSGDLAEAARGESPTVNDFLPAIAEPINEYQCELAANRIAVSPCPHDDASLESDLAAFRESLAASVNLQGSDRYTACVMVLTAAKELVKGIAYAAAYRFYDGDADRSEPDPKPDQWDRYMAGLWPDLLNMFSAIPAAGDAVDRNTLALAVYRMAERVLRWLEEIGIRYVVEMQGEARQRSCWWSVAEPI